MAKLDHNLDAYRLAAAALERLRALLRRHLEATHGAGWEKAGLPAETREILAQRREREAAVKWNSATGLDVLDFAGFVNLYEVLASVPRLRDGFSRLVPEPQALRLRFLELDTVLNRIAYARPVSESDMELLLGFDERLRALATDLPIDTVAEAAAPEEPSARLSQPAPAAKVPLEPAATAQTHAPAAPPAAAATAAPASPSPSSGRPRASEGRPARGQGGSQGPPTTGSIPVILSKETQGPAVVNDLDAALRRGDDSTVLTALYQEITGLAEKIWSDAASARSPIWEAVRESAWYENRFSALRLRVVSDFYDLLRNIQERQAAGNTRTDVHEFLKERNFAQILMDLREFFRPLAASSRQGRG
jgi:hypothetical protein